MGLVLLLWPNSIGKFGFLDSQLSLLSLSLARDSFEDCWSDTLWTVPHLEFDVFLMIRLGQCFFFFWSFWGLHPQHMEFPRLGVQSELLPPAYTTATAMPDPSCVCDPHHSSWQCQILNPLNEARDRTWNFVVPSWIHFCCTTAGTLGNAFLEEDCRGKMPFSSSSMKGHSVHLPYHLDINVYHLA